MATSRASNARAAVDLTFEELYRGHRADVYRAALRELGNADDAEDVTQAAFADAYRAVLRGTRPQSPRAWLLAISENVRRRRFRTAQRRPREEALNDADFPLAAELPYEQSRALAEALEALPPEQRRVFVLREIVGLSYAEIAEEVDSTVASIQMLLFRARRSLRDELEPPVVAIRRPGFLPPLPGWLAWALSRVEVASLTPRAAGALGATVLTVAGASVAVPVPQADAYHRAPAAAEPERAVGAKPAGRPPRRRRFERGCSDKAASRRAHRRPHHVEPRSDAPAAAGCNGPTGRSRDRARLGRGQSNDGTGPRGASGHRGAGAAPPRGHAGGRRRQRRRAASTAGLAPGCRFPCRRRFRFRLPVLPETLPPPVETATGAAGAAGASAPPLPVPLPPLPTLPLAP